MLCGKNLVGRYFPGIRRAPIVGVGTSPDKIKPEFGRRVWEVARLLITRGMPLGREIQIGRAKCQTSIGQEPREREVKEEGSRGMDFVSPRCKKRLQKRRNVILEVRINIKFKLKNVRD